jgi:hypothetical protein
VTIALGRPVGRRSATTAGLTTLAADLLAALAGILRRPKTTGRHSGGDDRPHVGATETSPVLDTPPVTNPLDPNWPVFEPDRAAPAIFDELDAGTPVNLDWQPPGFTETWSAAAAAALRERLEADETAGVK